MVLVDLLVAIHDDLARRRVDNRSCRNPSHKAGNNRLATDIVGTPDPDTAAGPTVVSVNDDVLNCVDQTSGEITSICRTQRSICQTLARTVRRDEVLQRRQPLAQVRANRQGDNPACRIGHQTAHTRELCDRAKTTLRSTRLCHNRDRTIGIQFAGDCLRYGITCPRPDLDRTVVLLLFRQQTAPVLALDLGDLLRSVAEDFRLLFWHGQIIDRDRHT